MNRFLSMCLEAGIAAVILFPVFWILNQLCFHNFRRSCVYCLFAVYLAAVDAVAGLPCLFHITFDWHVNLTPFAYMFSDYGSSLLNVLLFIPLGLLLTVLWKRYRSPFRAVVFGLVFSLSIELLQLFTHRATDVNDLITNTLGTILGWCFGRLILKLFPALRPGWNARDAVIVFGVAFGVMFFIQPFPAEYVWQQLLS